MLVNIIVLFILIIIAVSIYSYKECDIKLKYILYSFCAVLFINQLKNLKDKNNGEHFNASESNEALQNLASLYNSGNFTVSNLTVTGNLDVKGDTTLEGKTGLLKDLSVNGASTLSGITNHNNITTDNIITTGVINVTNIDDKLQKWGIYNMNGILRINPTGAPVSVDTSYTNNKSNPNVIRTAWTGQDGANRAEVGTSAPANGNNGYQDGYFHKFNSSRGDWWA